MKWLCGATARNCPRKRRKTSNGQKTQKCYFAASHIQMIRMFRATFIILIATSLGLSSCAMLRSAGGTSVAAVKTTTSSAVAKIPKISDLPMAHLLPGQGIKVVEVRERDLKDMPTGHELAQAHEKRKRGFWIFGGPVDFEEPSLPEPGSELDGSLLPPRMP